MLFMVTLLHPFGKGFDEFTKKTMELLSTKLPPYVELVKMYTAPAIGEGARGYTIFKVEKGRVDDGFIEIAKMFATYRNIEGVKVTIEPIISMKDAPALFAELTTEL